jgi:uncharacterized protein YndB with AHSA1/START domain
MSKMTLKTEGDKYVIVRRRFAASPEAVYRAHTETELIQKWPVLCSIGHRPFRQAIWRLRFLERMKNI